MKKKYQEGWSVKNRSRRQFLSYIGILSFIASVPLVSYDFKKNREKEELILINGWILKKGDLNDI